MSMPVIDASTFVKQLSLENGQTLLSFTELTGTDDTIHINMTLCMSNNVYGGQADTNLIAKMSHNARLDSDAYKKELRAAFMVDDIHENYIFALQNCEQHTLLIWKKILPNEELKIQLGRFEMKLIALSPQFFKTITTFFSYMKFTQNELSKQKRRLKNANEELQIATKHLSELGDVKSYVEKDLYSKFLLVLNEKKMKIRDLKRQIENTSSKDANIGEIQLPQFHKNIDHDSKKGIKSEKNEHLESPVCNLSWSEHDDSIPEIFIPPKSKKFKKNMRKVDSFHSEFGESSTSNNDEMNIENTSFSNPEDLLDNL